MLQRFSCIFLLSKPTCKNIMRKIGVKEVKQEVKVNTIRNFATVSIINNLIMNTFIFAVKSQNKTNSANSRKKKLNSKLFNINA